MTDPKHGAELLPEELVWADGGHASDIVLTALADGENGIVPLAVRAHVERCAGCMAHLGHASLLSLHTDEQLKLERAPERRPVPRLAVALGLLVAGLGLVPSLLDGSFDLHDLSQLARGAGAIAHRLDVHGGLFVTYGAAALLVCMGIAIARFLPKKEASR